jgi:hypothetical protein
MSAAQAQIIETQQRTIKRLERELSEIRRINGEASINAAIMAETLSEIRRIASECESVKIGELSACATQILNNKQPVAITRYSHREAVIIPTELLGVER